MSRLRFRYYMRLSFDGPVAHHRFTLKCIPVSDEKQRITLISRDIYPNSFISDGVDSFGNSLIYGYEESEHKCFFFDIRGEAICGQNKNDTSEIEKNDTKEIALSNAVNPMNVSVFRYQTKYTEAKEMLVNYSKKIAKELDLEHLLDRDYDSKENRVAMFAENYYKDLIPAEKLSDDTRYAIYVMNKVYQDFGYEKGVTEIGTLAEDAFEIGKGVCQDYAHIVLAILRLRRIPCRYVTGMMVGEGESHAWIEVYSDGFWLPLDPTNGIVVTDQHIKIAHGRDYSDCLVNQGVFVGNVKQKQEITVSVEEME